MKSVTRHPVTLFLSVNTKAGDKHLRLETLLEGAGRELFPIHHLFIKDF